MDITKNITFDMFTKSSNFLHANQFSGNSIFDRLGPFMKDWLDSFLDDFGVGGEPLIKGFVSPGAILTGRVYIAEGAKVEPTAYIQGPCFIGPNSEVRHGAYIRGYVYTGARTVIGHASEVKGSILLDGAKAAHFAYVGDSILCGNTNLGAGTRLANLKLKGDEVKYQHPESKLILSSGLRKFGAILGENASTGCNAVLSPGSLLMPNTAIYPCTHFHGTLSKGIVK